MFHRDTTIVRTAVGAGAGYVSLGYLFPRLVRRVPLPKAARGFRKSVVKTLFSRNGILGKYTPDIWKASGAVIGAEAVQ